MAEPEDGVFADLPARVRLGRVDQARHALIAQLRQREDELLLHLDVGFRVEAFFEEAHRLRAAFLRDPEKRLFADVRIRVRPRDVDQARHALECCNRRWAQINTDR